jgi:putative hemolysin
MILNRNQFIVKIAQTDAEVSAAQRLRYRVFVKEMGALPRLDAANNGIESDAFDPYYDHLIAIDKKIADDRDNVVGVYRLLQSHVAATGPGFYGAAEFDLTKITATNRKSVELGRSCIDASYRGGIVLQMMWQAVADYVMRQNIEILFGVASFSGIRPEIYAEGLSFLHHNHLAPPELRVRALAAENVPMAMKAQEKIDRVQAIRQIPSLIKSYLRLGGFVGDGAYVDRQFNTVDVCLILDRLRIPKQQLQQLEKGVAA